MGEEEAVAVALDAVGVTTARVGVGSPTLLAPPVVGVGILDTVVALVGGTTVGKAAPPHAERVSSRESSNAPNTPPRRDGLQFCVIGISPFMSLGTGNTAAPFSIIPYRAAAAQCARNVARPYRYAATPPKDVWRGDLFTLRRTVGRRRRCYTFCTVYCPIVAQGTRVPFAPSLSYLRSDRLISCAHCQVLAIMLPRRGGYDGERHNPRRDGRRCRRA